MQTKKQPYSNGISDLFIFICLVSLLVACSSCAGVKKDCQGNKHYKQKGGFYLSVPVERIDGLVKTGYSCPDCGEWGCIYEAIDDCVEGESDQDIENAIQAVCKERGINDAATIDLLRANYYL